VSICAGVTVVRVGVNESVTIYPIPL